MSSRISIDDWVRLRDGTSEGFPQRPGRVTEIKSTDNDTVYYIEWPGHQDEICSHCAAQRRDRLELIKTAEENG